MGHSCVEGWGPWARCWALHEPQVRVRSRATSSCIGCRTLCTAPAVDAWLRALVQGVSPGGRQARATVRIPPEDQEGTRWARRASSSPCGGGGGGAPHYTAGRGIPLCARCQVRVPWVNAVAWAGPISSAATRADGARSGASGPASAAMAWASTGTTLVQWRGESLGAGREEEGKPHRRSNATWRCGCTG